MTPTLAAPPSWNGAAHIRNLASIGLRAAYRITAHGAFHVGTSGPLVMVTNCEAAIAGAVLHAVTPRPIHVVANAAMMDIVPPKVMLATGGVPVGGPAAITAQRQALAALADNRAVVLAGRDLPTGYVIAASGAPVLPVVILGADGRRPTDPPGLRTAIDVYFSEPVAVPIGGDPLRSTTRMAVSEYVRQLVADAEEIAWRRAGFAGAPVAVGV